jgi:hypothetical protein
MTKCTVIEKQSTDIMCAFMFDNEIALGERLVVGVDIPQNSDLIPDDFLLPPPPLS